MTTLDALLARGVAAAPTRPVFAGADLTYAELAARVSRCAGGLAAAGVGPGDRVAIHLPKSPEAVIAVLATLAAGAAYVPVATAQPAARVARVLADAAPAVVLDDPGAVAALEGPPPTGSPGVADLAALLYTSGSTGVPKGVMLTHGNIAHFVDWAVGELALGPADVVSSHAGLHFDLSTFDVFASLSVGARIWLIPEGHAANPRALTAGIASQGVTVWYSVPGIWPLILETASEADLATLRAVLFAGEVFPIPGLRALAARVSDAALYNLYGPTETNVCAYHRVRTEDLQRPVPVPIGRAIEGVSVWDEDGELVVRGPTVSPGYWDGALPEPPHREIHRTGDRVTREGELFVFAGRRDRMLKLGGYRIEPGEVEAALLAHPAVAEAAVAAREDGGRRRLVGYCVARAGEDPPSLLGLKQHCATALPPYMIPHRIEWLEALPRTPNGKIDHGALGQLVP